MSVSITETERETDEQVDLKSLIAEVVADPDQWRDTPTADHTRVANGKRDRHTARTRNSWCGQFIQGREPVPFFLAL
jgi:hypothetical protein